MAAVMASPGALRSFGPVRSPGRCVLASSERLADEEAYAECHARVAQWRKDLMISANQEAQQRLHEVTYERERLEDLRSDITGIAAELQASAQLHEQGTKLREVLRSSAEAAAARVETVVQAKQHHVSAHELRCKELQQEQQLLLEHRQNTDAQYAEAERLLGMYRDRLALSITRAAPHTVRFAFTLLDRADPAKEFAFTLGLADQQKLTSYAVHNCSPHVSELPQLVEELNAQCRDSPWALARFVCSMRHKFQKVALDADA